jgi:cytochrome c5
MSDSHDDHSSGIKTPKQLIAAVVAGFIVPIIGIVLLVQFVSNADKVGNGSDALTAQAISERIRPVADEGFTFKDVNAVRVLQNGETVYKAACMACHAAGVAGSPKFGDTAAWSARIAQGYDTLVLHAVNGIRGMPAKGGNADLDNIEVARAVAYMANQAGANFKEPEAPAAGAATPAPDAAAPAPAAAPAAMATPTAALAMPAEPVKLAADTGKKL